MKTAYRYDVAELVAEHVQRTNRLPTLEDVRLGMRPAFSRDDVRRRVVADMVELTGSLPPSDAVRDDSLPFRMEAMRSFPALGLMGVSPRALGFAKISPSPAAGMMWYIASTILEATAFPSRLIVGRWK